MMDIKTSEKTVKSRCISLCLIMCVMSAYSSLDGCGHIWAGWYRYKCVVVDSAQLGWGTLCYTHKYSYTRTKDRFCRSVSNVIISRILGIWTCSRLYPKLYYLEAVLRQYWYFCILQLMWLSQDPNLANLRKTKKYYDIAQINNGYVYVKLILIDNHKVCGYNYFCRHIWLLFVYYYFSDCIHDDKPCEVAPPAGESHSTGGAIGPTMTYQRCTHTTTYTMVDLVSCPSWRSYSFQRCFAYPYMSYVLNCINFADILYWCWWVSCLSMQHSRRSPHVAALPDLKYVPIQMRLSRRINEQLSNISVCVLNYNSYIKKVGISVKNNNTYVNFFLLTVNVIMNVYTCTIRHVCLLCIYLYFAENDCHDKRWESAPSAGECHMYGRGFRPLLTQQQRSCTTHHNTVDLLPYPSRRLPRYQRGPDCPYLSYVLICVDRGYIIYRIPHVNHMYICQYAIINYCYNVVPASKRILIAIVYDVVFLSKCYVCLYLWRIQTRAPVRFKVNTPCIHRFYYIFIQPLFIVFHMMGQYWQVTRADLQEPAALCGEPMSSLRYGLLNQTQVHSTTNIWTMDPPTSVASYALEGPHYGLVLRHYMWQMVCASYAVTHPHATYICVELDEGLSEYCCSTSTYLIVAVLSHSISVCGCVLRLFFDWASIMTKVPISHLSAGRTVRADITGAATMTVIYVCNNAGTIQTIRQDVYSTVVCHVTHIPIQKSKDVNTVYHAIYVCRVDIRIQPGISIFYDMCINVNDGFLKISSVHE